MTELTRKEQLDELYSIYKKSHLTNPLYIPDAKQFVPGHGNSNALVMFIGEAPGEIEENTGLPFQGRSGQLFRKTLGKYHFSDENIFVTNVVKFRPPLNRRPTPEEIKVHYNLVLFHELQIIQPRIIVSVGAVATEALLDKSVKMTQIRGLKIKKNDQYIIPIFHPAYILRNINAFSFFEHDIKEIRNILDQL